MVRLHRLFYVSAEWRDLKVCFLEALRMLFLLALWKLALYLCLRVFAVKGGRGFIVA